MSENNDFGMKLKSYRKAREMSQADFAAFLGIHSGPTKTTNPGTVTRVTWKSSIKLLWLLGLLRKTFWVPPAVI